MHIDHVNRHLAQLDDDYTYVLNELIAEGREADANHLSEAYVRDAAELLGSVAFVSTI